MSSGIAPVNTGRTNAALKGLHIVNTQPFYSTYQDNHHHEGFRGANDRANAEALYTNRVITCVQNLSIDFIRIGCGTSPLYV